MNQSLGMGAWAGIVVFVFWMTVAIMLVVAQNIILAIFADAYAEAKHSEGVIEVRHGQGCWWWLVQGHLM